MATRKLTAKQEKYFGKGVVGRRVPGPKGKGAGRPRKSASYAGKK